MGDSCSKCIKKKTQQNKSSIKIKSPSGKIEVVQISDSKNNQEILVPFTEKKLGSSLIINEECKNMELEKSNNSMRKSRINWDFYFNNSELSFYEKLLKSEVYEDQKKILVYKKGNFIGEGSYGKVYQGFDEENGLIIAIKEINFKRFNRKKFDSKSFEKEIEILSKLNHPNIIKYYGASTNSNSIHILLEYCTGGSVSNMLEKYGQFKESLMRKYIKQILQGLEYLHYHNIIHTDIKGANILVDKDGSCKLSDFGGARRITEELEFKKDYSFKGTPHWMAPETIKKLEITRFSDIWSIGCTMIEMACGQPPWSEYKTPITALYFILNNEIPPEIPQFLSFNCQNFILNCLKMDPKERMNVSKLLRHPFLIKDSPYFSNFVSSNKIILEDNPNNEEKRTSSQKNSVYSRKSVINMNIIHNYNINIFSKTHVKKSFSMKTNEKPRLENVQINGKLCFTENLENNMNIESRDGNLNSNSILWA